MRVPRLLVVAVAVGTLALAGCDGPTPTSATSSQGTHVNVQATFAAPGGDNKAVTYNPDLVPVGATATVTSSERDGKTTVILKVTGLKPNRPYGAHAHVKPCGPDGMAAGPHYQFRQDPVSPSVDPAFANPENEIWLDFVTDGSGAGTATSTVAWTFPADRRAESVIIHEMTTATDPGKAGSAGTRAACITVDF